MQRGGRQVRFGASGSGGSYNRTNYQQPKKRLPLGKIWKPILACLSVLGLLYAILFSPLFRVRSIAVSGNKQLTAAELKQQTGGVLSSSFLGDNALFVSPSELAKQLKDRNYQLEDVRVEKSLLGGLRIAVIEQQATLQWRSGSSVFVLSGNGRAYAEAEKVNTSLPLVEDSTNLPVKIGDKIVPSSFVMFTTEAKPKFKLIGVNIAAMSVPETTTEMAVKTDKGTTIKLDTTRSLDSQLSDYRAVMAKNIAPKEYVDLRIAGKVFYK